MAPVDERAHEPEEEGEQQSADVGAVHIGIGHDDDFVVAQLFQVKSPPLPAPREVVASVRKSLP